MVKELWHILTTVANLTKAQERSNSELKVLDNYRNEINYVKEGIAAKFDVLTTRLDLKISYFESRLSVNKPASRASKSLKKPQHR